MNESPYKIQRYIDPDGLEHYNKSIQKQFEKQSKAIIKIKDDYVTLTLIVKVLITMQVIELILIITALAMIV